MAGELQFLRDDNGVPANGGVVLASSYVRQTAVGTNAGATTTVAAITSRVICFTEIAVTTDAASLITIEEDVAGTPVVLWKVRLSAGTGAVPFTESFKSPIRGTSGLSLSLKVSASTSNCEVNCVGFSYNPNATT